jgi:hypothetical protein
MELLDGPAAPATPPNSTSAPSRMFLDVGSLDRAVELARQAMLTYPALKQVCEFEWGVIMGYERIKAMFPGGFGAGGAAAGSAAARPG